MAVIGVISSFFVFGSLMGGGLEGKEAFIVMPTVQYATELVDTASGQLVPIEFASVAARISLENPPQSLVFLFFGIGCVVWLLVMFGIHQLRMVMRSVGVANPFTRENGRRLTWLAGMTLAFGVSITVSQILIASSMNRLVPLEGLSYRASIDFANIVGALVLWMIAEVFKAGVAMQEENELTV